MMHGHSLSQLEHGCVNSYLGQLYFAGYAHIFILCPVVTVVLILAKGLPLLTVPIIAPQVNTSMINSFLY